MQLKLTFNCSEDLIFDENNIRVMQGFIYKKLHEIGASYIHAGVYQHNDKVFRHFCFSDILTDNVHDGGDINYGKQFSFYFSTALHDIIPDFCDALFKTPIIYGHRTLCCCDIRVINSAICNSSINVITASPVVVDRTVHVDGRKKRHFYSPKASEFLPIVKKNLIDKYNSLHDDKIDDAVLTINNIKNCRKIRKKYIKTTKHKTIEIIIIGYQFNCQLKGDKRLLQTALYCGLGSKNAQGFGFVLKKDNEITN